MAILVLRLGRLATMTPALQTSSKAVAAFALGLSALGSGFLALVSGSDLFLLGIPAFTVLAIVFGIFGRREVNRAPDRWQGKGLAGWGMGIPMGGLGLGFLLLPAV